MIKTNGKENKLNSRTFRYSTYSAKKVTLILLGIFLCCITFLLDITTGSSGLTLSQVLRAIIAPNQVDEMHRLIVWEFRMPVAIMGVLVGAALGLSGAVMQTILNNPLASPYTLGLSAGAGFGASVAMVTGLAATTTIASEFLIAGWAFVFALLTCFGIYFISRVKRFTSDVMVLAGIGMVFFFQAGQSFLQYIASDEELAGIVFWTFGSLTKASHMKCSIVAVAFVISFILVYANAWQLTAMNMGDERARGLGVDIGKLRKLMFIVTSLVTATAVAFVGSIGFIGIVGPHFARMLLGEDQRYYLPMSAVCGALVLSVASVASKMIIPGAIFPIGILTSLLGVPVFFAMILRKRG